MLVRIDLDAAIPGAVSTQAPCHCGVDVGTYRRIRGIETLTARRGGEGQPVLRQGEIARGTVLQGDADGAQMLAFRGTQIVRTVGGDQGQVGGVGARELGLAQPAPAGADHGYAAVGDLVAVADRTIAQPPRGDGAIVQRVRHRRAPAGDAGGERHRSRVVLEHHPIERNRSIG